MFGRIIGIIISFGLIWGGLSGELVLRGTNSSIALVVVGCIFLVYDIVMLFGSNNASNHNNEQVESDNEQQL